MSSASKVFKKALKVTALAAVVWFSAGTAANFMAAPAAGMGSAMSAQAATMYETTASVFAAQGAAPASVGLEGTAGLDIGATALEADIAGVGAQTSALAAPEAIVGTELAGTGALPGVDIAATSLEAEIAGAAGAGADASTGLIGWAQQNPALAVVAGSGAFGAYGAYEESKTREEERRERRGRGLGGVDYAGEYKGRGLIAAQQPDQATQAPVIAAPGVSGPQVQPGQDVQRNRSIQRKNLPALRRQGLIAKQQVA